MEKVPNCQDTLIVFRQLTRHTTLPFRDSGSPMALLMYNSPHTPMAQLQTMGTRHGTVVENSFSVEFVGGRRTSSLNCKRKAVLIEKQKKIKQYNGHEKLPKARFHLPHFCGTVISNIIEISTFMTRRSSVWGKKL